MHLDAAHAGTIGDSDANISILTPAGTPRVLDLVVGLAVVGSVADSQHSMVKFSATVGGDDATGVSLEHLLVGLDGDRDRALNNGSLESI